tara:strand:+ start:2236 stop:2907 length:672 start_codon:yes stop_codon:yes gene_type:complete
MNFFFKDCDGHFTFYKNDSLIKVSENNPLLAVNLKHAELILKDLKKKKVKTDPFSVLGLSIFACSLDKKQLNEIVLILLKDLDYDLLLFRFFEDKRLLKLVNQKYDPFVNTFNNIFNIKLSIIENLTKNINNLTDKILFKKFLLKLNNFYLTALLKLSSIGKSVILSYFFLEKKIDTSEYFKLINLENRYQQDLWGYVDEQKKIDQHSLSILKKISFFLKSVN